MSARYSVLIVGCGNIAGGFDAARAADSMPMTHAGAFTRHGGFTLAACIDPDAARGGAFAERWDVALSYQSWADLPVEQRFDVISICSPTAFHADDMAAAIAMQPRLIFCEKPVTPTLADTERAVAACAEAGIALAINHTRRWAPDVQELARQLAEGRWGQVRSVSARYNKGVLNNGAHMMDLLLALLGPLDLQWAGRPVADFWPDDPTIPAVLTSKSGVPVQINVGHARDYATFELSIVTEKGVIGMEDGGLNWRLREAIDSPHFAGYKALDAGQINPGRYDQAMLNAAGNIHDAMRHGAPLLSTGESALAAQTLCHQIRTTAERTS